MKPRALLTFVPLGCCCDQSTDFGINSLHSSRTVNYIHTHCLKTRPPADTCVLFRFAWKICIELLNFFATLIHFHCLCLGSSRIIILPL